MLLIKSRLFYIIGVSIYLFLKLRWGDLFKLLLAKPKTKKINHNSSKNVYKEADKTLVSIVHGDDIYALLKEGINLIGGLARLDIKGRTVLIKPNIVNRYPSRTKAPPSAARQRPTRLRQGGARRLFVGDMSA